MPPTGPKIDYTGKRFGMLVVVACTGRKDSHRHYIWEFRCDCGNTLYHTLKDVKNGDVSSCGCLARGRTKTYPSEQDRPTRSPGYRRWNNMYQKCYNPNNPSYRTFGGAGIGMCREWKYNPYAFVEWYNEACKGIHGKVMRRNPKRDYCPDNCYVED